LTEQRGTIRFGYHGSRDIATEIVRAAGRRDDEVELSQYDVADPFRSLRHGELDVMIVKFGLREPDLARSAVLATDARAAIVGTRHPLAGRDSVSVEELAEFDAFKCPGTMPAYIWDEVVPPTTPAGRRIHRRHEVTSIGAMMALVASTDAVHLSLISLAGIAPPTVRVIPIHDLTPAPVSLAWPFDRGASHVLGFVADAEAALAGSPR
jgi:DNA-binding transcriptional LysR family regulator